MFDIVLKLAANYFTSALRCGYLPKSASLPHANSLNIYNRLISGKQLSETKMDEDVAMFANISKD